MGDVASHQRSASGAQDSSSTDVSQQLRDQHVTGMHVDDVVQVSISSHPQRVVSTAVAAAKQFAAAASALALTVAPVKSIIVASSRRLATEVRDALSKHGLPIHIATSTADLGVDSGCGGSKAKQSRATQSRAKHKR